jgi:hypothetical protein
MQGRDRHLHTFLFGAHPWSEPVPADRLMVHVL